MITQGQERQIQRSGLMGERQYGIALSPKIYSMMSDKLYTDRVGSVVREVCSNAWDAQKMRSIATGQPMEPFKVTLPTDLEPHFIVEDSGPGMPDDVAQDLYSTLGLSTKENTNDQIGAFGLGSKSPFAVTDTFTVENTYEGVTHHYLCFKAESGLPSLLKTGETKDGRPNGVKVMVPAAGHKYMEYKRALSRQLIVMDPKPIICNIETFEFPEPEKTIEMPNGFILGNSRDFNLDGRRVFSRMGMVLYPVDMSQIQIPYNERFHEKIVDSSALILEFNIGDLEPLPSREGLTYDERTKKNILEAYQKFAEGYMEKLRKVVEEQPNPLEAWRKINEIRNRMNVDLIHKRVYNLGFVIDNSSFQNAFPYFEHRYQEKRLKSVQPLGEVDEDGNMLVLPPEYEMVDTQTVVSQFYYEVFTSNDKRLNIKREANPMRMDFRLLDQIDSGNIQILIMDEIEPKYRVGRMKSVLNSLGRYYGKQIWVVRVDSRYSGAKDNFDELIKSFEMLHRGITKKFLWFSDVPKPEIERKARDGDGPIDGICIKRPHSKWEDRVRWSDFDSWMTPIDADEESDDYEDLCEEAKKQFLSSHFYILANRNDLVDYPSINMDRIFDFANNQNLKIVVVRKTGMNKLKDIQELGLKEFKEFINEKLDGHEVSEDYKKYSSSKKIIQNHTFWFRISVKNCMESLRVHLKEKSEFIHPFFSEHELVVKLSDISLSSILIDEKTNMINHLRLNSLFGIFVDSEWAKIVEIDISQEFADLENQFNRYYPAFGLILKYSDTDVAVNTLLQYVVDYNALRGADVQLEDFTEEEVEQTNEVKETEDENV